MDGVKSSGRRRIIPEKAIDKETFTHSSDNVPKICSRCTQIKVDQLTKQLQQKTHELENALLVITQLKNAAEEKDIAHERMKQNIRNCLVSASCALHSGSDGFLSALAECECSSDNQPEKSSLIATEATEHTTVASSSNTTDSKDVDAKRSQLQAAPRAKRLLHASTTIPKSCRSPGECQPEVKEQSSSAPKSQDRKSTTYCSEEVNQRPVERRITQQPLPLESNNSLLPVPCLHCDRRFRNYHCLNAHMIKHPRCE